MRTPADIRNCFADSYMSARKLFLHALREADGALTSYKHPMIGAEGEELYVDVGIVGDPKAKRLLCLMSGTHGVEGFCGSAIQIAWLRTELARIGSGRPTVVLIHVINPFGFSYCRRVNEDNVDLNRNFVDYAAAPENPSYMRLAKVLSKRPNPFTRFLLVWHILRHGLRALQDAVSRGQYQDACGLFYGGKDKTWSRSIWDTILQNDLAHVENAIFIDYHTGLGPHGHGEIICPTPRTSCSGKIISGLFARDEVKFIDESNSVSARVSGDILSYTTDPARTKAFAGIFLEFGTIKPLAVLVALIAENWLHHRKLHPNDMKHRYKRQLREAFCPADRDWQTSVWERARQVTNTAALALGSSPTVL